MIRLDVLAAAFARLLTYDGGSTWGTCSHCHRTVDNHDDDHRVTSILDGGRGVECVHRGDITRDLAMPLGPRPTRAGVLSGGGS